MTNLKESKGREAIRQAILAVDDVQQEEVEAWGMKLLVRGLTAAQRDDFEASMVRQKGKDINLNMSNMRTKLAVLCIVDEEGKRVFGDTDVAVLSRKSGRELNKIFKVAQRLSGISDEDVEGLAKNSESGQPGDLHTD